MRSCSLMTIMFSPGRRRRSPNAWPPLCPSSPLPAKRRRPVGSQTYPPPQNAVPDVFHSSPSAPAAPVRQRQRARLAGPAQRPPSGRRRTRAAERPAANAASLALCRPPRRRHRGAAGEDSASALRSRRRSRAPRPRRAASARAAAGEGASQAAAPAHAAAQAPPAAPDATNGGANGGLLNNNHGHASAALNKGDYSKFVQFFRQASPYIVGHRRAAAAAAADRRIALWPRGWRWPTASQRRGEQPAC